MSESEQLLLPGLPSPESLMPVAPSGIAPPLISQFTRRSTMVYLVLTVASVCFLAWPNLTNDRLDLLEEPFQTAQILAERGLEFYEASRYDGCLLGWIASLAWSSPNQQTASALEVYREVLAHYEGASERNRGVQQLRAHLAVLLAELGQTNALTAELRKLRQSDEYEPFAALLRRVYLEPRKQVGPTDDRLATKLEPGWAQDRLRARLAYLAGRSDQGRRIARTMQEHGRVWRARILVLGVATLVILALGGVLLTWLLWKRRFPPATSAAAALAPWSAADGFGVILRAEVWGQALLLVMTLLVVWPVSRIAECESSLIVGLPLLWLLHRYLLRPCQRKFSEHFGFSLDWRKLRQALVWMLVLTALNWTGDHILGYVTDQLGLAQHWTDGLDEELLYGTPAAQLATTFNAVLFAPFFEEVFFRGVLFATLYRPLGLVPAALVSGLVFGCVHFYSWAGFLGVAWFGFLYALVYARTRNLAACVLAHGLNNFVSTLSTLWMLG